MAYQVRPAQRDEYYARKKRLARLRPFVFSGIALMGCLLVFLCVIAGDYILNAGKIHYGIKADGYKIGGMTVSEATKYLDDEFKKASDKKVVVRFHDKTWTIKPDRIKLTFKSKLMAQRAFQIGRSQSFIQNMRERFGAYGGKQNGSIIFEYDRDSAISVFDHIQPKTNVASRDSWVELKGDSFVATEGHDGQALNTSKLLTMLAQAFISGQESIDAPVEKIPLGVSLKEAQKAAEIATNYSANAIVAKHGDKSWKVTPANIKHLLVFKNSQDIEKQDAVLGESEVKNIDDDKVYLVPVISSDKVGKVVIEKVGASVGHAAVNARFSTNAGTVTIIPSKNGVGVDPVALAQDIAQVLASSTAQKVVELKTTAVEPEITTAKAQAMGIKDRIATFSTTFSSGNKPRVTNIQLLAKSLDNVLVGPGKTFSFNGTVGERTAEKGYQEAGAIVDGELVEQLGGGICQVNTTLFNAVLLSGLPITQRINHSNYISHYPLGRDATVSWGGPDFKFVNNTKEWVLISSSYTNSSVTISLYGTDPGYEVSLSTGSWENKKPYPTKKVEDPQLKAGTKVVESSGVDGGTIKVTRMVTKDGKTVSQSTFTSRYVPKPQVVRIGTKGAIKDKIETQPPTDQQTQTSNSTPAQ